MSADDGALWSRQEVQTQAAQARGQFTVWEMFGCAECGCLIGEDCRPDCTALISALNGIEDAEDITPEHGMCGGCSKAIMRYGDGFWFGLALGGGYTCPDNALHSP